MGEPSISQDDIEAVTRCVKDGWVSGFAPIVSEFEKKFAQYLGTRFAVACSSGTAALHLALVAAGVGKGDQVIVNAHSPVYPINAILYTGATPVLVDSRSSDGFGIDYENIHKVITRQTKVILPVHWYGIPDRVDRIREFIDAHYKGRIVLIEDTAEALGAELVGRKVGTFGELACFSTFSNKLVTSGCGGVVVTGSDELYERLLSYRSHCYGKIDKFIVTGVGFNYRMPALSAALGLSQLGRIEDFLSIRRSLYDQYKERISSFVKIPAIPCTSILSPWMFPILVNSSGLNAARLRTLLQSHLDKKGIDTRLFYRPVCAQTIYNLRVRDFPNAYELWNRGLTLPLGNTTTFDDVDYICNALKSFKL
jgi:perosamine synthetase